MYFVDKNNAFCGKNREWILSLFYYFHNIPIFFIFSQTPDGEFYEKIKKLVTCNLKPVTFTIFTLMQFEIPCPNGHNVRFGLKFAGTVSRCPKCSEKIQIPMLDELRASLGEDIDAETKAAFEEAEKRITEMVMKREQEFRAKNALAAKAAAEKTAVRKSEVPAANAEEEMIEFACPNGHQLSAPVSKAGKTGTCPHCTSRFIVPGLDDEEEAVEEETEEKAVPEFSFPAAYALPPTTGGSASSVSSAKSDAPPAFLFPDLPGNSGGGGLDFGMDDSARKIPRVMREDPMARMFWKFWSRRGENTVIELHTEDGKVIIPENFLEDDSEEEVGVFEMRNVGAHLVTIGIRWTHICRVQEKKS